MPRPKREEMPALHISPLEEDLLTLLNGRELYPLQIERALKEVCGRRQAFGSLYPVLRHLEKRRLLSARWGDEAPEERGGPRRRYYTIADPGKDALKLKRERLQGLMDWRLIPEGG